MIPIGLFANRSSFAHLDTPAHSSRPRTWIRLPTPSTSPAPPGTHIPCPISTATTVDAPGSTSASSLANARISTTRCLAAESIAWLRARVAPRVRRRRLRAGILESGGGDRYHLLCTMGKVWWNAGYLICCTTTVKRTDYLSVVCLHFLYLKTLYR